MDSVNLLNLPAPDFTLPDLDGVEHRLYGQRGRIVLLNFWSAECPWSTQADSEIVAWQAGWGERVSWWSIAANANEPVELLRQAAQARQVPLLLHDPTGIVADLYHAQTTPHAFVIDGDGILRYQGAVNDRTFRQRLPQRFYLQEALAALLSGRLPDPAETPPYGCTIVRIT